VQGNPRVRVLQVDDDPSSLDSIRRHLEAEGVEVVTAKSGFAALKAAQSGPFDLVTLDLLMPRMNGYETFLKLKEILGEFAFIIITAHKSLLEKYSDLGAKAVTPPLIKGEYDIQQILECVKTVAQSRSKTHEGALIQRTQLSNSVEWAAVCVLLAAAIFFLTSCLLCTTKQYVLFDPLLSLLAMVACITLLLTALLSLYLTRDVKKTKRR